MNFFIIFITLLIVQNSLAVPVPDENEFKKYISFNLYKDYYEYDKIYYEDGVSVYKNYPQFDPNQKTIFYLPGWSENPNSRSQESIQVISEAIIKRGGINLIVLDYSQLIQGDGYVDYLHAFKNSSVIGRLLGTYFTQFIPSIQTIDKVHIVSHSMGSQIMSYAAQKFGSGLLRLTALDPAGPLYSLAGVSHLTRWDGSFVDVIHTDAGNYGDARSVGTIDFFPNHGKRIQPYCVGRDYAFCSHHMSWRYYAESFSNPRIFIGRRCISRNKCVLINTFGICDCNQFSYDVAYMGYEVSMNTTGDFYLTTSNSPPYGIDIYGLEVN